VSEDAEKRKQRMARFGIATKATVADERHGPQTGCDE